MLSIEKRAAPALNAQQALGSYVYSFDGRPLVAHSGSGGGFAATLMFDQQAMSGRCVGVQLAAQC